MKALASIFVVGALAVGWTGFESGALAQAPPNAPGITSAEIDESKVERTIHVDASATGDAAADGSQTSPFKEIKRAFEVAARLKDSGKGVKVIVADGVYRGAAFFPEPTNGKADTDAPLIIEAANRQQAFIDGAETVGWEAVAWTHQDANWIHQWPEAFTAPAAAPRSAANARSKPGGESLRYPGLIFLGGIALRQVASLEAVAPGTFCISGQQIYATSRRGGKADAPMIPRGEIKVILQPPEGADADGSVEVSAPSLFGFVISNRRNVVLRGLALQHGVNSSNDFPGALTFKSCSNVLVEDVLCQWNSGVGISILGRTTAPWTEGITLRRVQAINNGGSGIVVSGIKGLLAEDCETSFNNFRGDWSSSIDPLGPAGFKAESVHGGAWRRHHATGNHCRGLWWGADCADITVEDSTVRDSLLSGLFIENSLGPVTVRRCVVTGTKPHPSARDDAAKPAAVSICATPNVTLESVVIANNSMPQLGLWNVPQRADAVNFETKAKETNRAERHVYRHNVFLGLSADQPLCNLPATGAGKGAFDAYYNTLTSDENCFWNPALAEAFCTYDKTNYHRPGMDLTAWRAFLAASAGGLRQPEAASLWQDPLFVDPAEGDFRLKVGSPAADWNLTSDERASE